jgi:hypothetical protein
VSNYFRFATKFLAGMLIILLVVGPLVYGAYGFKSFVVGCTAAITSWVLSTFYGLQTSKLSLPYFGAAPVTWPGKVLAPLDESQLDGSHGCVGAVRGSQLGDKALDVELDGTDAEPHLLRDFPVRTSLRQ